MKKRVLITKNTEETHDLGKRFGHLLKSHTVILMDGDLGAGKTTLTQGIAKGLEIERHITSPTFTILKIYQGRLKLYHIDAYRLEGLNQDLGFEEFLNDDGVTIIEWPQYVPSLIPSSYIKISIKLLADDSREFTFISNTLDDDEILEVI